MSCKYPIETPAVKKVVLNNVFTVDSSGDATLTVDEGINTITHSGSGQYGIILDDSYDSLVDVSLVQQATTASGLTCGLQHEDVDGSKEIIFTCLNEEGNAAQPINGTKVYLTLTLKR